MGNGFGCNDCGFCVAGANRAAVKAEVKNHEHEEDHTMYEFDFDD